MDYYSVVKNELLVFEVFMKGIRRHHIKQEEKEEKELKDKYQMISLLYGT